MQKLSWIVAGAALVSACSQEAAPANNVVEAATALQPGEYELTSTFDRVRSTDNTTPATKWKAGSAPVTTRTCLADTGAFDPAAFAEGSEKCTASDTYLRNGRISLQYRCTGDKGGMSNTVDGDFTTADAFTATVNTSTIFGGTGDYELVRKVTGKRVGACTPKAA